MKNQTLKHIQHSILMSYACNILSFIFNYLSFCLFYFVQKLCKLLFFDKDFEHNNFIKFALIVNVILKQKKSGAVKPRPSSNNKTVFVK
jgi:hypothetical protein